MKKNFMVLLFDDRGKVVKSRFWLTKSPAMRYFDRMAKEFWTSPLYKKLRQPYKVPADFERNNLYLRLYAGVGNFQILREQFLHKDTGAIIPLSTANKQRLEKFSRAVS